ncbi:MAG: ABC transporter permease subunit [Pseudomonadota bacterium]|nr:ABC transporter permease subunit [Pseudomonadota bacterium]
MNDIVFRRISIAIVWFWLAIFALAPTLMVVITSILESPSSYVVSLSFTLDNYRELFDLSYAIILIRSVLIAAGCTLLCLLISYPFAYGIAQASSRYKPILLLFVIIPFWTSSLIRAYAIMTILKTHGFFNDLLLAIGIIKEPMQLLYSNTALFIGLTYTLLPFMMLPLYANMEKLDHSLIEAARDLGATKLTVLRKILIPLTMPGIATGVMMVFLPSMTLFYIPVLLGGAKSMLLGNLIQNQFLSAGDWPLGAATSMILIILMMILGKWYWAQNNETSRVEML